MHIRLLFILAELTMRVVIEGVSGPGQGRTLNLRKDQVLTVGRTEWSDVAIENDAQISARHFTVEHNGKVVVLNDLQSTNGVRVNGEEVQQAHLQDGDQIAAGLTTFVVHIKDVAGQHTPLAPNPYPNAPQDPAHPDNYATGQAPGPAPQNQSPQTSSPPGNYASPIGGSPIGQGSAPPPQAHKPSTPQSVGQSPIAGYQTPPSTPPQAPLGGSPSATPTPQPPATPSPDANSPISPIMYDGGGAAPSSFAGSAPNENPTPPAAGSPPGFSNQGAPPPSFGNAPIQNAPIPNSPIAPPPTREDSQPVEQQRHIVPSQRQKVKSAGAGALNFTRNETKNDRVIYRGLVAEGDEEREFAPSGVMALLGGIGPYLIITHHQRAGFDAPEFAADATPLFDWMPPDTARGYSPIVVEGSKLKDPYKEIDELWDKDALLVVLVKDPEEAKKHLVELTKWNPFGVEQNTLFGYCWPKVLAQFVEHGDQDMADKTFDKLITGFFFEDTNQEKNWQIISDVEFGKKLEPLGFVEVQNEPDDEGTPESQATAT